jgi:hypothetical protein
LLGVFALNPAGARAAPPPNDNFANAQVVGPGVPIAVAATTAESTAEAGEPPHFSTNPATHTVWYSWTPTVSMTAVVDVCDRDPGINLITEAVYTGDAINMLTSVASTAGDCMLRFSASAGQNYKIAIDTNSAVGAFTFRLRQLTPPANDNFVDATPLPPSLSFTIGGRSNVDATTEPDEPAINGGALGRSVWFNWTAPTNASVRLDLCDFDTRSGPANRALSVWTGTALANLTQVFSSDTLCRTTFNAVSGTTYRISFSGTVRGEGTFTLEMVQAVPPANDAFASAIPVGPGLPVARVGDNVFATVEAGEPNHGEYPGNSIFPPRDSVWYTWTPAASEEVSVSVCNDDFSAARLGVYTGDAVDMLTKVTPAVPITSQPFCSMRFNAVAGTTYRIAVGGSIPETEGTFVLDLQKFNPPPPATPTPAPARTPPFNLKAALKKCKKLESRKQRRKCIKKAKKRAKREGQIAGSAASQVG